MKAEAPVAAGAEAWPAWWRTSRPVRLLLLLAIVGVAGVVALTAAVMVELRTKATDDAARELARLDLSLTEQTARSFESVDLILTSVIDRLHTDGINSAADYAARMSDRASYELLHAKTAGVPELDAVTMIAADGHLINFSRYFPIPAVNVADRDYFQALAGENAPAQFLSGPVQNRGTGTWTIYLARRVEDSSGHFIGLVLGSINLDYFQQLYRVLESDEDGSIGLWRRDGTLLARYPVPKTLGHVYASAPFIQVIARGDTGIVEAKSSVDGIRRIAAFGAVRGYPIMVSVSRTTRDVLASWRREATIVAGVGTICAAALGLVFWTLLRLFGSYEVLQRTVAQREEAIHAREQAEEQVSHLVKMEALGQLTGGIAHDFNNLLTVIIGNLDLLRRRLPEGADDLARHVDTALRGAERGATMTHRLLAFSRRQPLAPAPLDANRLIAGMSELLQRTLGETVAVEPILAPELWKIYVDASQLESAVLNLAVNARDAMPEGGRLTIETANTVRDAASAAAAEAEPGDFVLIAVSDTGIGMSAAVVRRAFEPFFTTKEPGRGTGLGLSQVYGFIKQSGGHIEIRSTPGAGTAIELYLPRHAAAVALDEHEAPTRVAPGAARQETILVVEDETEVRRYAVEALAGLGYRVFAAADGYDALRRLEEIGEVALLITDIGLPGGLNGHQLAEEMRLRRPGLAVLFVTGYSHDATGHREALSTGIDLVAKPFTAAVLASRVRLSLDSRRRAAS